MSVVFRLNERPINAFFQLRAAGGGEREAGATTGHGKEPNFSEKYGTGQLATTVVAVQEVDALIHRSYFKPHPTPPLSPQSELTSQPEPPLRHPGVLDIRGRSDFSRFDPSPERPRFSNFGPPAERRPFFVERRPFCEMPPAVGL